MACAKYITWKHIASLATCLDDPENKNMWDKVMAKMANPVLFHTSFPLAADSAEAHDADQDLRAHVDNNNDNWVEACSAGV